MCGTLSNREGILSKCLKGRVKQEFKYLKVKDIMGNVVQRSATEPKYFRDSASSSSPFFPPPLLRVTPKSLLCLL